MVAKTRRYCPDGHIYDQEPFNPCCHKATDRSGKRAYCPQGHPFDEANTYLYRGRQACRECRREYNRQRNQDRPSPHKRQMVRDFIKLRDKGRCRYCGRPGGALDHVTPRCNGGPNDAFDNMVWCCRHCNNVKGSEAGFTMRNGHLYWHGRLVEAGKLFGATLLNEVRAQRTERQLAQGLTHLVEHATKRAQRGGAS